MKTGRPPSSARSKQPYRLRALLHAHDIPMAELRQRLKYASGPYKGNVIAPSTLSEILCGRRWATTLEPDEIKATAAAFLRERGVPEDQIATAWEPDGELAAGDTPDRLLPPGRYFAARSDAPAHDDTFHAPEPEMLTPEARKHFSITRPPFIDDVQGPQDLFKARDQIYVRQSMYDAAKHTGLIAVIGESGSGKSTLRRDLLDRIAQDNAAVIVVQPKVVDKSKLNAQHICEAVIADLSTESPKLSLEAKARQVERLLTKSSRMGNQHVLVIEEAHDLTNTALKYLKRFWELEDGYRRLLGIVLVGQPELQERLDERRNYDLREFIRRCEIAQLRPLDAHLEDYLKFKFARIGLDVDAILDKSVYDAIRARLVRRNPRTTAAESQCYPLIVQNLIVRCLNAAAELGLPKVTADLVARVGT